MVPAAPTTILIAALLAIASLAGGHEARAGQVTIYRCTDAKGHLSLRDSPCRKGEKQEAREMVRPKDPPPRPRAPAVAAPAPAPRESAPPRYVMLTPPRPMYECVTPDGERYLSETGEGRSRWEPAWLPAYPVYPYLRDPRGPDYRARVEYNDGRLGGSIRIGSARRPHPVVIAPVHPAGSWVRDACFALPQAEVCDRLRDQRYELNRRWNIAQPSERAQIDRETRSIDARLGNDCGGR